MKLAEVASCLLLAAPSLGGCASNIDVSSSGSSSAPTSSGGGATASGSSGGWSLVAPLTIPAPTARDMVYDEKRHRLYITTSGPSDAPGFLPNGGTDGKVLVYNLETQQFDTPLLTGGCFVGVDLSPDGNLLLVADHNTDATHNWVYRIDLTTGEAQRVLLNLDYGEAGTFTTVFTSDTRALVTSDYCGSGWAPLREVDLTNGTVLALKTVSERTMLTKSADGSTVAFAQANGSDGEWGTYDIGTGAFADSAVGDWFIYEIAVSRTASQFAIPTYGGMHLYDASFKKTGTLGTYATEYPVGAVYSPIANEVYVAWYGASTSIDVYDTNTLAKVRDIAKEPGLFDSFNNLAFYSGRMRISDDGAIVFATSMDSIVVYPTGL